MPAEISLLTEADIPAAVSAVQEAFADDPYYNWVFDTAKFDKRRNTASVGIRCRSGIRQGLYYIAKDGETGKTLGVSMWLPPRPTDRPQSWSSWLDDWRVWLEQVGMNLWYGRGGLNLKRYWIWRKAQAQAHQEIWTDPRGYYFLNIMVVTSEARGRGIGRRLVAAVTDKADREGMPCYLESSKAAPNIQIYERLGFRLAGDIVCEDEDEDGGGESVKLYCMIRDPQPQVPSLARGKEEDLHQA